MLMRAWLQLISCALLCAALAACAKTDDTQRPPAASNSPATSANSPAASGDAAQKVGEGGPASSTDVVKATAAPAEVAAGGSFDAGVKLQIAQGYHINANQPTFSYLKPTELSVEVGEGLTADKPVYPRPVMRSFSFEKKPLAVYEGETEIKLPLKAAASAQKGTRTLAARLSVQACDDRACYKPGTLNIPIALTVK